MSEDNPFDMGDIEIHWCPGCGNYAILSTLKATLQEMGLTPQDLVIISGIGQAGKTPHFLRCNYINGLHGRALPVAMAVKALNPELVVLAVGGDGDMYGEGGNHLIHAIRRNINVTTIVHDNFVYGLTKGQASPTSLQGFETPVQTGGVKLQPFSPIAFAISQKASFVAQANAADREQTKAILKAAINHDGFALVNIFQPCVVFNKLNTYKWFKEHTYSLSEDYDPTDQLAALELVLKDSNYPLGILYKNTARSTFEETLSVYAKGDETPVINRKRDIKKVAKRFFQS
ncbi:MAG: 2-oxoacid ferredoxin oxidoreductase [Candidatus Heimdallarchaeota archaeon]|nr:2-oxoacid ferredoxin oxidoreductase [Candidatus Heimdallarchaeota archaeon]